MDTNLTTQQYVFDSALVDDGAGGSEWHRDVLIEIDDGCIADVTPDVSDSSAVRIAGVAIPAIPNVHSHAFQRGFAGMSEYRTAASDSFWTWRKLMYDFVGKLSPEDVFVIARQLYLEMIVAGYSWVGEFHYLHNQPSGDVYDNCSEMLEAVVAAAQESGIGICLLPVLYQRSGFESETPLTKQRRFVLTSGQFGELCGKAQAIASVSPNTAFGVAAHSLRAVSDEAIKEMLGQRAEHFPGCPVHIHIAEQVQEVDDCISVYNRRPIEHLFERFDVDSSWCLIHATHLTKRESVLIAESKAVAGLCPTTEANLGDGFFEAADFLANGGTISIGSDSHCSVDAFEEMRLLEYAQRLRSRSRTVLATQSKSNGRRLFEAVANGGGQAIGVATGKIAVGFRADLLVIAPDHPTIAGAMDDRLLDRLVFCNTGNPISKRMLGGNWIDSNELSEKLKESSVEFLNVNQRLLSGL